MISAGDFRNGITLEIEGGVYQIVELQHVKPGKGAAFGKNQDQERDDRRSGRENLPSPPRSSRLQGSTVSIRSICTLTATCSTL